MCEFLNAIFSLNFENFEKILFDHSVVPKMEWEKLPRSLILENDVFVVTLMCNLANMRSFPNLWKDNLIKIIDSLHLNNHKRSRCRLQPQCFEKGIAQC